MTDSSTSDNPQRKAKPTNTGETTHFSEKGGGDHRMNRRQLVGALGAGAVAALAGCIGDDDDTDDDPGANGFGDDDDDDVFGEDDESDDETFTDDTDDDDGEADDVDDDTMEEDDDDTESELAGTEFNFEPSFIVEGTAQPPELDDEIQMTSRHYHEDFHQTMDGVPGMGQMEMYVVDGTFYQVMGDDCFKGQQDTGTPDIDPDVDEDDDMLQNLPSEPDRTDEIDGEPMDVYEISEEDTPQQEGGMDVYISSVTGYLRRMDSEMFTMDYHSWGEVGPIEPPDMECQEMGGGADY